MSQPVGFVGENSGDLYCSLFGSVAKWCQHSFWHIPGVQRLFLDRMNEHPVAVQRYASPPAPLPGPCQLLINCISSRGEVAPSQDIILPPLGKHSLILKGDL